MKPFLLSLVLAASAFGQVFSPAPRVKPAIPSAFEITLTDAAVSSFSAVELYVGASPYDGTVGCHFGVALGAATNTHYVFLYRGGPMPSFLIGNAGQGEIVSTANCKLYQPSVMVIYAAQAITVTIPFEATGMAHTVLVKARHRLMPTEQTTSFTY